MKGVPYPRPIRLPLESYENPENTFHLVIHAFIQATPFRNRDVADVVWSHLTNPVTTSGVVLLAACLMPDHLHLLVKPNGENIVRWVGAYKSLSTREAWGAGWRGRLWQPSFWDRRVRDEREWESTLFYVRHNPVAAGLVDEESEWPWTRLWLDGW